MPPFAWIRPKLVELLLMPRGKLGLVAEITPAAWLVMPRPLLPICPAPSIRLLTLTNAPALELLMIGCPLEDACERLTVPPPERVTMLLQLKKVLCPAAWMTMVPVLLIEPKKVVVELSSDANVPTIVRAPEVIPSREAELPATVAKVPPRVLVIVPPTMSPPTRRMDALAAPTVTLAFWFWMTEEI